VLPAFRTWLSAIDLRSRRRWAANWRRKGLVPRMVPALGFDRHAAAMQFAGHFPPDPRPRGASPARASLFRRISAPVDGPPGVFESKAPRRPSIASAAPCMTMSREPQSRSIMRAGR
jgi:hypothetical protein